MSMKNVAGAAATAPATELESGCQSSVSAPILPKDGAVVKPSDLALRLPADVRAIVELQDKRHVPTADIVEVVAAIYPKFDRFLLSKVRHGAETGVRLRDDALKTLSDHFRVTDAAAPKPPARKKPHRIQCRLTDAAYEALQRRLRQTGQNAQDYLEAVILADLKNHGKELRI